METMNTVKYFGFGPPRAPIVLLVWLLLAPCALAESLTGEQDAVRLRIKRYEHLLQREPGSAQLKADLAEALLDSSAAHDRVKGAQLRLALSPKDHKVRIELAEELLSAKRYGEALEEYRSLLIVGFEPRDVLVGIGEAYDGLKRPARSLEHYEQAHALVPHDVEVLEHLGDGYGWLGRYGRATAAYRAILKLSRGVDATVRTRVNEKLERLGRERAEAERGSSDDADDADERPLQSRIRSLLVAIIKYPDRKELRLALGNLYLEAELPEQAVLEFLLALSHGESRPLANLGLARAYADIGILRLARAYFHRAVKTGAQNWAGWYYYGRWAIEQSELENALACLQRARETGLPRDHDERFRARLFMARKNWSQAQAFYEALARREPEDTEALEGLSDIALVRRDEARAVDYLEKALLAEPGSFWLKKKAASLAMRRVRYGRAAELLEQAWQLRPGDLETTMDLAFSRVMVGKRQVAFDAYVKALSLAPYDLEVISKFRTFLEMAPLRVGHRELYHLLREKEARGLAAEGNAKRAIFVLERLKLDYEAMGQQEQKVIDGVLSRNHGHLAKGHLVRALALARSEVRVRRLLAELYLDVGQEELVRVQYHEILELDPTQAPYVLRLAEMYHELGKHRRARHYYSKISPDELQPAVRKRRAQSFELAGSETDGLRQYKRLESEAPADDEVLLRLGEWQLERGNLWRAKRYFHSALGEAAANREAHESLRRVYLERSPDITFSTYSSSSSDGIVSQERVVDYKTMHRGWRLGGRVGYFELSDRFAESSGPELVFSVGRDFSQKADWRVELGLDPRYAAGGPFWQAETVWHVSDLLDIAALIFRRGMGETAFGATQDIVAEGALLRGEAFCSTTLLLRGEVERATLSDGNERSRSRAEAELALPWKWLGHLRGVAYRLDYTLPVAPIIYYSPQGASGREFVYELHLPAAKSFSMDLGYTWGFEDNRRDYRILELGGAYEVSRNRLLSVEYRKTKAERSIYAGPSPVRASELGFNLGVLF